MLLCIAGEKGQVKKAGKLLPFNPKRLAEKPKQAGKMSGARSGIRQGTPDIPGQKVNLNKPGESSRCAICMHASALDHKYNAPL